MDMQILPKTCAASADGQCTPNNKKFRTFQSGTETYCDKHYQRLHKTGTPVESKMAKAIRLIGTHCEISDSDCNVSGRMRYNHESGKTYCDIHSDRLLRTGTTDASQRGLANRSSSALVKAVLERWNYGTRGDLDSPCQTTGSRTSKLYRKVYELTHGPIPENMLVRHLCNNGHKSCIEPGHLATGYSNDNGADMAASGIMAGENHPRATLTNEQALAIFKLGDSPTRKQVQTIILSEHGATVPLGIISNIRSGKAYSKITGKIHSPEKRKKPKLGALQGICDVAHIGNCSPVGKVTTVRKTGLTLCRRHYSRQREGKPFELSEESYRKKNRQQLKNKILQNFHEGIIGDLNSPCILFAPDNNNRSKKPTEQGTKTFLAAYGPAPKGLHVLHKCNNGHQDCGNLGHMKFGSVSENGADKAASGIHKREKHPNSKFESHMIQWLIEETTGPQQARAKQFFEKFDIRIDRGYVGLILRGGTNWTDADGNFIP